VVEVPLVPETLDLEEFAKTVEADRRNEAGWLVRWALRQVGNLLQEHKGVQGKLRNVNVVPDWSAQDAELWAFLDEAFRHPWAGDLAQASRMPLGVIDDVQTQTQWVGVLPDHAPEAALLLVARGRQQQAQGHPETFVEKLAIGLAMIRQVRHLQPTPVGLDANLAQLHL